MKKLLSLTAAVISAFAFCASASGLHSKEYWKEYIRIWEEEDEESLLHYESEDGGVPERTLDSKYFTLEQNYIIKIKLCANEVGNEDYDDNYRFYFVLNDGTECEVPGWEGIFHERERNCCTTAEVLKISNVSDPSMLFLSRLTYNNGDDYDADLESVDFYPCTNGWNTIDGEKYYVKSDGVLATKSMTINGVRYKFAKSGVCEGKYTGWTKTSKGKRYWKNGKLLKNKNLRTKSGKVYRLDGNGYAALVE